MSRWSLGLFVFAVFNVIAIVRVYADFQPCNTTVAGAIVDTTGCGVSQPTLCGGTVVVTVEQKTCANENEDPCTPIANSLTVTYGVENCNGVPSGGCAPQTPPCGCSQDLSSRVAAGKGSTC